MQQPNLSRVAGPEDLSDLIASCQVRVRLLTELYRQDYQRLLILVARVAARSIELGGPTPEEALLQVEAVLASARRDPVQQLLFVLSPSALRALDKRLGEWIASLGGAA